MSLLYLTLCVIVVTSYIFFIQTTTAHCQSKRHLRQLVQECIESTKVFDHPNVLVFTKDGRKILKRGVEENVSAFHCSMWDLITDSMPTKNASKYLHFTNENGQYKNYFFIVRHTDDHVIVGMC